MKVKVSLALPHRELLDITIACDVTTTVNDVARALIRSGTYQASSNVDAFQPLKSGHVTLLAGPEPTQEYLLDPLAPLGQSGLQSGWRVRVAGEFDEAAPRLIPQIGSVEVVDGKQAGTVFSLVAGQNLIGRDGVSRVQLEDRSVSRRHAVIEAGHQLILHDLGSANGIAIRGKRYQAVPIDHTVEVVLGSVTLRITPDTQTHHIAETDLDHRQAHTRAPRVDPYFPPSTRELPAPPQHTGGSRIPLLAMLAPMLMGGAMFALTRSPMSLMMAAFSPIMMVGSWFDGHLTSRRKHRRDERAFSETLERERTTLADLSATEIATRAAETPTLEEIAQAMRERGRLLWARRPEHRSFLEVRLGEGMLPSRTRVTLPARGEAAGAQWESLLALQHDFAAVDPVPVIERFDRCGSIGVVGDTTLSFGLARALLIQLVGLHSPAELSIAAFVGNRTESRTEASGSPWEWLKWLPHVDPVGGPIAAWQLADEKRAAARLLIALEHTAALRRAAPRGDAQTVRSHDPLDDGAVNNDGPVNRLPITPAVVVLVLDAEVLPEHRARLIALAEEGPDLGIHFLWVATSSAHVPAACRTFGEIASEQHGNNGAGRDASVSFVRQRRVLRLSTVESLGADAAADLARAISPVDDAASRGLDESDLPDAVQLREIQAVDVLGGSAPILQNWERSGSLVGTWQSGAPREAMQLAAVVGQGSESLARVDLRAHGPHALVGGTTGAGKSEFLQSWIMSLAANISPDRLTFLLVDYKGGAAFAECVGLPHTVGLVTDLSPHLVRRALISLRAELRRREELLAEHGAKDLITMEQRSDPAAPPVIVIVIDEFATLVRDVPEFIDGVIDIAQRGRSLGLHLVMATQRPAGVVTDNLRANTNLRIALRMSDEAESSDVLGVPDAAFFAAETPGRAAMKVGPGRLEHFQTGYLGGRTSHESSEAGLQICTLRSVEGEPWSIPAASAPEATRNRAPVARDIERLRDSVIAAAAHGGLAAPRKPWLEPLPNWLPLETLDRDSGEGQGLVLGLVDLPETHAQSPARIDFDEAGNVAIFGASGAGKTTALLTIAAAASSAAATNPVNIYAIDAGGGALNALDKLPTVGAVAQLADAELTQRVLRALSEVVSERGTRFAAARASSLSEYRTSGAPGAAREARTLLLVDGFAALTHSLDGLGQRGAASLQLSEIMRAGRAVGVHVVLTADRASAVSAALAASVQERIVLRLASAHEYAYVDVTPDTLEGAAPGRAVFAGSRNDVQLACVGRSPDLSAQAAALEELAEQLCTTDLVPAPRIRNAPEALALGELSVEVSGRPVFGIDTRTLTAIGLPVEGLGVIAGPAGSGLTTAARSCVHAITRWATQRGEEVDRVLLSFASEAEMPQWGTSWEHAAHGETKVEALARDLVAALGGRPHARAQDFAGALAGGAVGDTLGGVLGLGRDTRTDTGVASTGTAGSEGGESRAFEFPAPGRRGVIVVERPVDAEGTAALPQLVALAKAAKRASVLVLFEFEQGAGGAVWELFTALKQPAWGLSLQPDEGEGQTPFRESVGRVARSDFPPGRGFAIERGRVTPVHVAQP